MNAPLPAPAPLHPAYGVYTEFGRTQIPMQPGTNVRRFNFVNQQGGAFIFYDKAHGIVTLGPGTYRISAYSLTTFGFDLTRAQQKRVRSVPGYAFLWNADTGSIAITGSMQDPLYSLTSFVDDVLTVANDTRFFLGHQNGKDVDGVLLESINAADPTSTNHVFARLAIERLDRP